MMNLENKMFSRQLGQIIVTFAFLYSTIVCHFKAIELFKNDEKLFAFFLWVCAATSFLGAFRFLIAKIVYKIRGKKYHD